VNNLGKTSVPLEPRDTGLQPAPRCSIHATHGLQTRATTTTRAAWRRYGPALLAIVGVVIVVAASGCGPPPLANPAFARYQNRRSPAFDRLVQTHADAANDRREELILLTTWFLDGDPRAAMMCRVRPDGHVTTFEYVYDAEVRGSRKTNLVPDQLAALRQAIRRLPPSQSPRLEDLLIVSFLRDGRWITRTYDRTAPPPAAAELFAVTGAPIQPAPRQ